MNGAIVIGVVALVVVAALAVALVLAAPRLRMPPPLARLLGRLENVVSVASAELGRITVAAITLLAGSGGIIAVLWSLGWPVKIFETRVDHPIFEWFQQRQDEGWGKIWRVITNIGSLDLTQALTVIGAVALAALYAKRRWWVPLGILPVAYVLEKTMQDLLLLVVDRGHPPTTLGSFPSGGCARVILIYGLIAFFLLRRFDAGPRLTALGVALVAFAETLQAYARIVNLEHWFTDVVAGVVFGVLLISTCIAAALVLDRNAPDVPAPRRERASERQPQATRWSTTGQ